MSRHAQITSKYWVGQHFYALIVAKEGALSFGSVVGVNLGCTVVYIWDQKVPIVSAVGE